MARLGGGPLGASLALYGGYALGLGAMLFSLRYDRETSFMVTIGATLLLAPLLWDHYLAALILPAAFLAQRGRLWGLGLPLLAWLPPEMLPMLAVAGTFVPFVVRRPRDSVPTPSGAEDLPQRRVSAPRRRCALSRRRAPCGGQASCGSLVGGAGFAPTTGCHFRAGHGSPAPRDAARVRPAHRRAVPPAGTRRLR